MKRLVFANLKGGCGKTTSCLCLGMHLAKVGKLDVACLDLDVDQQSAFNMIDNLGGHVADYAGGNSHDYLLIDTPAGLPSGKTRGEIDRANLIIVPARPSGGDWNSTFTFLEHLTKPQRKRARLLFTNVMPQTKLARDLPEMRRYCLKEYGVKAFSTTMNLRTGYAMSMTSGWPALPKAAREELAALATQVATAA
jgi:chromosome partitioning protein